MSNLVSHSIYDGINRLNQVSPKEEQNMLQVTLKSKLQETVTYVVDGQAYKDKISAYRHLVLKMGKDYRLCPKCEGEGIYTDVAPEDGLKTGFQCSECEGKGYQTLHWR